MTDFPKISWLVFDLCILKRDDLHQLMKEAERVTGQKAPWGSDNAECEGWIRKQRVRLIHKMAADIRELDALKKQQASKPSRRLAQELPAPKFAGDAMTAEQINEFLKGLPDAP
jgi:hypothetical protein